MNERTNEENDIKYILKSKKWNRKRGTNKKKTQKKKIRKCWVSFKIVVLWTKLVAFPFFEEPQNNGLSFSLLLKIERKNMYTEEFATTVFRTIRKLFHQFLVTNDFQFEISMLWWLAESKNSHGNNKHRNEKKKKNEWTELKCRRTIYTKMTNCNEKQ